MTPKRKSSEILGEVLLFATAVFLVTTFLWASPDEKSKDLGFLAQNPMTQFVMGQSLVNSDPRNPEGYRLMATSQRAESKWMDLLKTVEKAERNGILDPYLCRQKTMAFLSLGNYFGTLDSLACMEILARAHAE